MRPHVDRSQKFVPGIIRIMNPETAWGVWIMDSIIKFMIWCRLASLLLLLKGSEQKSISIHEYGFKQLPEWTERSEA